VPVICEIAEHENQENSNVTISEHRDTSPQNQAPIQLKNSKVTPKKALEPVGKTKVCCKGCNLF